MVRSFHATALLRPRAGLAAGRPLPRKGRSLLGLAFLAGSFFAAPAVLASPDYPSVLAQELDMPCTPQCILCHLTNPGRAGNARQDFPALLGIIRGGEPETVRDKARELVMSEPDVVQALREGRNPNVADSEEGDVCALDVRYGCGARVEPKSSLGPGAWWPLLLAAGGIGAFARRRRPQQG